jgi:hypothetical protein
MMTCEKLVTHLKGAFPAGCVPSASWDVNADVVILGPWLRQG